MVRVRTEREQAAEGLGVDRQRSEESRGQTGLNCTGQGKGSLGNILLDPNQEMDWRQGDGSRSGYGEGQRERERYREVTQGSGAIKSSTMI